MSRHAYVTKREAPSGYVAVTKPYAAQLYEQGIAITMCLNNVNAYHIFHGWHLGYTIDKASDRQAGYDDYSFKDFVVSYLSYNANNELGTYAVFYVKASDIKAQPITNVRCRTCGEGGHQISGQCVLCATRPSTAGK